MDRAQKRIKKRRAKQKRKLNPAKYECCDCHHSWQLSKPAQVTCAQCGSVYVQWVNYVQWKAASRPRPRIQVSHRGGRSGTEVAGDQN